MYNIFVMSDGTGRTARQMVEAALTQYHSEDITIHLHSNVRHETQALAILQKVVHHRGILFHTIVSNDLRKLIIRQCGIQDIANVDMMGPMLAILSNFLSHSPSETPGLFAELNEAYFKRIEAMEFAFRHDDGQRPHELHLAEIVLVGVSRTFKTPLSMYLGIKGFFVANVPIILGLQLPDELFQIPPERVIALRTRPSQLAALRKVRQEHLDGATGDYAALDHVRRELEYATRLFAKFPKWHQIDVTNKPIEEIASEILSLTAKTSV